MSFVFGRIAPIFAGTLGVGLAVISAGALGPSPLVAEGARPATVLVDKECPAGNTTGRATFTVSLVGVEGAASTITVRCDGTTPVTAVDGRSLHIGDRVRIHEQTPPTGLVAAEDVTATLTESKEKLEFVNLAALSIMKVCDAGVSGAATFSVSGPDSASVQVTVPCGETMAVPITEAFTNGSTATIHETAAATKGLKAADAQVTINLEKAQVLQVENKLDSPSAPVHPPVPVAHLAGTGGGPASFPYLGWLGLLFLLSGALVWRSTRRQRQ